MELIVDLHIHSHFSRATSPAMNVTDLYRWGKIKGINVIGTGDFTHPQYFVELREKLKPAENGLFKLKDEFAKEEDKKIPASCKNNFIRFILTVEISNIYSKNGKVRKLHNLIIVPSFEVASFINAQLSHIGNLKADGRPILGMDSKRLLQITLESHKDSLFIPAHIWTPWFSMFGSKSGFDSIEEAFEELSPHIRAVETGLSSDPFMNWRLKQFEGITLVSNSDAHSPQKLGREANILACEPSYKEIIDAVKTNDERFIGTIEFFPQEGKYHFDGHRVCNVVMSPTETKKHNGICPVCKKSLVIGVDYRVGEIADYPENYKPARHKKVEYIIPLSEILSEIHATGSSSKKVTADYEKVIAAVGSEFDILRKLPVSKLKDAGFDKLAYSIQKMRSGDVFVQPGYDGVYGVIKIFKDAKHRLDTYGQSSLF